MLLDLMIPFHLRHPLEAVLVGSIISLLMMLAAFSLMSRAHRLRKRGRARGPLALRLVAGPLMGLGTYLATTALATEWVARPYLEMLTTTPGPFYLAMGVVIGTAISLAPTRILRIIAGSCLGSVPILTVPIRMALAPVPLPGEPELTLAIAFGFVSVATLAGMMTATAAWLCASPSHIARAGAALFATSALTITLSAVPTILGRSNTVWSTSTGIITPFAAISATSIVFVLIACAIAEHFRLAGIERSRREMQRSQDRLDGLTKASFEGLIVHRDGLIVDWNERFCEMSHWRPFNHLPPARVSHLVETGGRIEVDGQPHETVLACRNGERMPVEILSLLLTPGSDDPTIVTAVRDITQRKAQDAAITHMARHDGLTDLLNRNAFHDETEKLLRANGRGALVLIDLDHFKPVNDTHGHHAGDHVLKTLARRFRGELREGDLLARLGGDEFAVFLLDPEPATRVAERLIEAGARPVALDVEDGEPQPQTKDVRLSASIGVALYPSDADTFDALLQNADAALYRAKGDGRGRFFRHDPRMKAYAEERLRMEEDLKCAVLTGGLSVAYQPIFAVASGETAALEALVRWDDAYHGEVEPDVFLPIAEDAHMMPELGRFVMAEAFATAARTGLKVCVNVSPQQLADRDFLDDVDTALAKAGIGPDMVELEVTERVLRREEPIYVERLHALAERGFPLALDDFGAGPSALSALHRYPFGRIKLDGGFLRALNPDTAPELLAGVLGLARIQKMRVTAEGIESHADLALMTRVGLDNVQGYLLARPGDAEGSRRLSDAA